MSYFTRTVSSELADKKFSELRELVAEERMLLSGGKFVIVSTPEFSGVAMHINDVPSDVAEVADLASRSTLAFESSLKGEPFPRKMKDYSVRKIDEILSELFFAVHDKSNEQTCLYVNLYGSNALVSILSKSEIEKWHNYLLRNNRLELSVSDPSMFHYTARELCVELTKALLARPKTDSPYR